MPQRSRVTRLLLRYMPEIERTTSPLMGVSVGIAASVVGTGLRILIDPYVEGVPFITYFPMLAMASIFGGLWGGLTSLALDTAISVYFWLPPRGLLEFSDTTITTVLTFILSGGLIVAGFWALDEVVGALRRSEQRSAMIAQEMQHRMKNLFQLVLSISSMTARDATSAEDHKARLNARLETLSRALEAPRVPTSNSLDLKALLIRLLQPFDYERFNLRGPSATIADSTASMFGLAIHELATNAIKYGALSVASGRVSIAWQQVDGFVTMRWRESGGPLVNVPSRTGFGSKLLAAVFKDGKGSAAVSFEATGLVCVMNVPTAPNEPDNSQTIGNTKENFLAPNS